MGSGFVSRNGRTPYVPPEAAGLFAALEAQRAGDSAPLASWHATSRPCLEGSLRRAGMGAEEADQATEEVVERALDTFRRGGQVRDEPAWIARVARNLLTDEGRRRRTERRRIVSLSRMACRDMTPPAIDEADSCRRLAAAVLLLRSPYREAMCLLTVAGIPCPRIQAILMQSENVGISGARHILRRGCVMLARVLVGRSPGRTPA